MEVKESAIIGARCRFVFSKEPKSTFTVSVMNEGEQLDNRFGVLVYAIPHKTQKTVSTVLIGSEDQTLVDSASSMAKLLSATTGKPTYLNTTVRTPDFMLLRDLQNEARLL